MNQKFTIYHANMKNTGCALSLELKPDTQTSNGRIVATFAPHEALGISEAISASMSKICFGL